MVGVAAAGSLVGEGIKVIAHRARPTPDLVQVLSEMHDFSFPSGHVLFYTAFFGFLAFVVFTRWPASPLRRILLSGLGLMIAMVGVSRVYLGHHWASDALGSYLLGTAWLAFTIQLYRWGKEGRWRRAARGTGAGRPQGSPLHEDSGQR
jgi:undecaprenyl-diphosphatase